MPRLKPETKAKRAKEAWFKKGEKAFAILVKNGTMKERDRKGFLIGYMREPAKGN